MIVEQTKQNVNQHYVPQSFIQAWGDEDEKVVIYHLESRRQVPKTPIDETCADNYFYSINPKVDQRLGRLNGQHLRPIRKLRKNEPLLGLTSVESSLLVSFIAVQRMRTKQMREGVYKAGDELLRKNLNLKYLDSIPNEETLKTVVEFELDQRIASVHHMLLQQGILGYIGLGDLHGVILENETDTPFICSDAPVVLDNPRFKHQQDQSYAGIANTGLVIYCPIDPQTSLVLYDSEAYKVVAPQRDRIEVGDPEDVDDLNHLQLASASDIVFYDDSTSEEYVQRIHDQVDNIEEKYEIERMYEVETGISMEHVYSPPEQIPTLTPDIDEFCYTPEEVKFQLRRSPKQMEKQERIVKDIRSKVETDEKHILTAINYCLQSHGIES